MTELLNYFSGKRVLILGFGREGKSTLDILKNADCSVGIADMNRDNLSGYEQYELHYGEKYLDCLDDYDIIMKTPGIALFDNVSESVKSKITSQTDLLLNFCKSRIIGVTGTKGKSTVSSLIYHILRMCGKKTVLVGNIGVPPLMRLDEFSDDTEVVCEMSCHQLEYITASPQIAVLLNVYEEHLDHYTGFEAYRNAKENIFRYQKENSILISAKELSEDISDCRAKKYLASLTENADIYYDEKNLYVCGNTIPLDRIDCRLCGKHNIYNIGIAVAASLETGCALSDILAALPSFECLEHRLERFAVINGAEYINDSISTIPRTAIAAVKAFDKVDTIIIGGMDRGICYDELADFLNTGIVENVILLKDSGYRVGEQLCGDKMNVYYASDFDDAVAYAKKVTKVRCLLSPASASYGFFKNFEERGTYFKKLVLLH